MAELTPILVSLNVPRLLPPEENADQADVFVLLFINLYAGLTAPPIPMPVVPPVLDSPTKQELVDENTFNASFRTLL